MACCNHCMDAQDFFNDKHARRELKQYRKKGAITSTQKLIDALCRWTDNASTLLDVGGGIGAIDHELLRQHLDKATLVEASPAYLKLSREEAERQGHGDRLESYEGDFVDMVSGLPVADLVTMDRVICCYPYMEQLVTAAASRSRQICGVVYPRERWFIRAGMRLLNWYTRLRRKEFRVYVHPRKDIDATFRNNGFELHEATTTLLWHIDIYAKAG